MYRNILMACDEGPAGDEVLRQGAELAVACRAHVTLMAVVERDPGITLVEAASPPAPSRTYERAFEQLQARAATLRMLGLKVSQQVVSGEAHEAIAQTARAEGADLIIVGRPVQSPLSRWWRGTTGASLIPGAPCSVLVAVPSDESEGVLSA